MSRAARLRTLLAIASILGAPASAEAAEQKVSKQARKYLSMTPDDFKACTAIKDDSLDTIAVLNTSPCFQEKRGILGIVWNDNFLRAFIDKRTGATTYQVYQYISYQGDWRFYNRVNYESPVGPQSRDLTEIGRNVVSCSGSSLGGGCLLSETIAFDAPESLLRIVASKFVPGAVQGWRFKYYSKSGQEWPDALGGAEVAGILKAVDAYRAEHGLAAAPTEALPK